jgi:RHS repeat-associated protein
MVFNHTGGSVAQDEIFYPWGERWNYAGTLYDERFASMQQRDAETGNDPTLFRMYHPRLYRWLSPDPVAGDITNPQSLNRYAYVLHNPTNLIDPLGLQEHDRDRLAPGRLPEVYDAIGLNMNCTMDGIPINCMVMQRALSAGFAQPCLNGPCTGMPYIFRGTYKGKTYDIWFPSWDAFAAAYTSLAAQPESQIYAAFLLACEHSTAGCIGQTVTVVFRGGTYNVTVEGSVTGVGFPSTLPDPLVIEHADWSYYTWSPINVGHMRRYARGFAGGRGILSPPWHSSALKLK